MEGALTLEDKLRRSQRYNRGIIEAVPAPMLVVDAGFGITDVNEQAVTLTGRPRAELIGSPLDEHFAIPPPSVDAIREMFGGGTDSEFELTLKDFVAGDRALSFRASIFHDPDGARRGVMVFTGE